MARLARAVREWSGWFVVAAGAVLCVLGWYGVSGESVAEQQLPYLASATIPGAAMIVAGAVLIASRPARRGDRADERIETLYTLLVADADSADAPARGAAPDDSATLLAVPGGTLYHRRDCPLVADKPTAEVVDAAAVAERSLVPCPVCEPPAPAPAGLGGSGPVQPTAGSGPGRLGAERDRSAAGPDRLAAAPDRPAVPDPAADSDRADSERAAPDHPHPHAPDSGPDPAGP